MKKCITNPLLVFLFIVALILPAKASELEPPIFPDPLLPYIGVTDAAIGLVRMNNGDAQPTGYISLRNGYYANATLALYKEGSSTPTASWYQSSGYIFIYETYSVPSGYTYYATLAAAIYDANNNYVDTVNLESNHVHF